MEAPFEQARMKAYRRGHFISVYLRRTVKKRRLQAAFFQFGNSFRVGWRQNQIGTLPCNPQWSVLCISDPGQSGFWVLLPDGRAFLSCFACAAVFKARLPTILLLALFMYSGTHIA